MMLFGIEHTEQPCPSCTSLLAGPDDARGDRIRIEMLLPVPIGAHAPMSRYTGKRICFDCAAAEGLMTFMDRTLEFPEARIVTGSERQEMLRLPGVQIGLRFTRPSAAGDLDRLHPWQQMHFGSPEDREAVRDDMKKAKEDGWTR